MAFVIKHIKTGLCFYPKNGLGADDVEIVLSKRCQDRAATFVWTKRHKLKSMAFEDFCLHPKKGRADPEDGTKLVIFRECRGKRLRFAYDLNTLSLRHEASGKYVKPENPDAREGTNLVISREDTVSGWMQFEFVAVSRAQFGMSSSGVTSSGRKIAKFGWRKGRKFGTRVNGLNIGGGNSRIQMSAGSSAGKGGRQRTSGNYNFKFGKGHGVKGGRYSFKLGMGNGAIKTSGGKGGFSSSWQGSWKHRGPGARFGDRVSPGTNDAVVSDGDTMISDSSATGGAMANPENNSGQTNYGQFGETDKNDSSTPMNVGHNQQVASVSTEESYDQQSGDGNYLGSDYTEGTIGSSGGKNVGSSSQNDRANQSLSSVGSGMEYGQPTGGEPNQQDQNYGSIGNTSDTTKNGMDGGYEDESSDHTPDDVPETNKSGEVRLSESSTIGGSLNNRNGEIDGQTNAVEQVSERIGKASEGGMDHGYENSEPNRSNNESIEKLHGSISGKPSHESTWKWSKKNNIIRQDGIVNDSNVEGNDGSSETRHTNRSDTRDHNRTWVWDRKDINGSVNNDKVEDRKDINAYNGTTNSSNVEGNDGLRGIPSENGSSYHGYGAVKLWLKKDIVRHKGIVNDRYVSIGIHEGNITPTKGPVLGGQKKGATQDNAGQRGKVGDKRNKTHDERK